MLIIILSITYLLLSVGYVLCISFLLKGLLKIQVHNNNWQPTVTVIIAARNEEKNIGACLDSVLNQNYPGELVQFVVVDDRSVDKTVDIVQSYSKRYSNLRLLQLPPDLPITASPKKQAIEFGITQTTDEIILTTDADCVVPNNWIPIMTSQFDENTGAVCGWVRLEKNTSLFSKVQSMESFGLITAGAGAIEMGRPLISNGANLAYRRSVFNQIGGFVGIDHLTSGDDDLLIQKIHQSTSWKIKFASQIDAMVYAQPCHSFRDFFNQRKRWISKILHYKNPLVKLLLLSVYIYFLLLFIGTLFVLVVGLPVIVYIFSIFIKPAFDYLFISAGLKSIGEKVNFSEFILAEIGQILYVLLIGPWSLIRGFEWKGRNYRK